MDISSVTNQYTYNTLNNANTTQDESNRFEDEVNKYLIDSQTTSSNETDDINDELEQFKNDLITKGSVKFLYDFNQEKIEKMVEEYKEKLLKELEENPDSDMDIEQMVIDYKKEILENLAKLEEENKSPTNINKLEDMTNNNKTNKLEDLLKM
jgi:glutamyl-tRNA reductase